MLEFVPQVHWLLIALSLFLLAVALVGMRRSQWPAALVSLVLAGVVLWRAFQPTDLEIKGGEVGLHWGLIALLYLSMLAGMASQYFYLKTERTRFRWSVFIKPALVSPVIFLPLLAGLQDHLDDGPWNLARLMLLFVAFQNGFVWKTFFDAQAGKFQAKP